MVSSSPVIKHCVTASPTRSIILCWSVASQEGWPRKSVRPWGSTPNTLGSVEPRNQKEAEWGYLSCADHRDFHVLLPSVRWSTVLWPPRHYCPHLHTVWKSGTFFFTCSCTCLHLIAISRLPPPFTLLSFDATGKFCHAGGWHLRRKPSGEYFCLRSPFSLWHSPAAIVVWTHNSFANSVTSSYISLIEINIYAKNLTPSSTLCSILLMTVLTSAKSGKSLCYIPASLIRHIRVTAQQISRVTADHHVWNSS